MGNVYINVTSSSGVVYTATIERLADGFYREDDAEVFGSGLAFADKNITLTEGSAENRGSYSATLVADDWDDGIYKLRVHNENGSLVSGGTNFGVVGGYEVTIGEVNPIYTHDIRYIADAANSQDEYYANFYKNGVWLTTGITSPTITVTDSSGSNIIDGEAMSQVGATGTWRYTTTAAGKKQTAGEAYSVAVSATIDSGTRTFAWLLGRDSSA